MKTRDVVIVFSDMDIYDWDDEETKIMLSQIASKSSTAILASTRREVEFPGWVFIKVNVD